MLNALHYVCWHLHGCMFTGYQAMRKLCKPEQSRQHLFLLAEIASFTWKYGFQKQQPVICGVTCSQVGPNFDITLDTKHSCFVYT